MFCPSNVRNFVVLVTFAQFGMLDEVGRRSPSQADAFAQYLAGRFLASSTPEECLNRMERETGIEPATSSLGSWRSTAELLPLKPQTPSSLSPPETTLNRRPARVMSQLEIQNLFTVGVIPIGAAFQAEGGISHPRRPGEGDPSAG